MLQPDTKKILRTFMSLKPEISWSFKNATRAETTALTHSYHRYPAKFIPNIVEKLLNDFTSRADFVLDPFGGCGTTLVESKRLGRKSIGFDINPVAKFIAEVKVTPISPQKLETEFSKLEKKLSRRGTLISKRHLGNKRLLYWFEPKTIKELDYINSEIKKIKDQKIRKFFFCAFSHNLKNSSRWLMKSTKPTIDSEKKCMAASTTFLRHAKSMVKKNRQFYTVLRSGKNLRMPSRIFLRDSTKKSNLKNDSIDLIVTSPPYVTSYEYADLHQLSLLWFGIDKKNFKNWNRLSDNFIEFRKNFVGTSYNIEKNGEIGSKIGEAIISDLRAIDKSLAKDVSNYFIDMRSAFFEMYRVLKPGKYACVIIGDTQLRGVDILNAEVATEQMLKVGFSKDRVIKREVPNKMITPWRDIGTGKFTNIKNPNKKCAYEYEYVLLMKK